MQRYSQTDQLMIILICQTGTYGYISYGPPTTMKSYFESMLSETVENCPEFCDVYEREAED